MRGRHATALTLAGVMALGLAACGSSSDQSSGGGGQSSSSTSSSSSSSAASKLAVTETEFAIAPAAPKVAKTGSVTFTVSNKGKFPHALVVEGNGIAEQKTDTIAPGQSATLTVDLSKAGTYEWYCPIDNHRQMGMDGKVTVGSGGGTTTTDKSKGKSAY
jgi:uncharacterized cupredoxin-like copper-binding protein